LSLDGDGGFCAGKRLRLLGEGYADRALGCRFGG
jgi:hypothetical protein